MTQKIQPITNITCDLAPYDCIQPPPIVSNPPCVYIYVWMDAIGFSKDKPLPSDLGSVAAGDLAILEVSGEQVFYYDTDDKTPVDTAIDYGDYHSIEVPF